MGVSLGKSYKSELKKLEATYNWALTTDISEISSHINKTRDYPLLTVGSGGSLTTAIFTSLLHEKTGIISKYLTPLEFVSTNYERCKLSIILITASGGNSDVLTSLKVAINREPNNLIILCGNKKSQIKNIASKFNFINLCEYDFPFGKDGFLATNSILAFNVLLARAYKDCFNFSYLFPKSFQQLIDNYVSFENYLSEMKESIKPLLSKKTIIVLYDLWGKPVSYDLESKFSEGALGNIQLADYRNFAHGRHNWINNNSDTTGIISIITREDEKIAQKTLNLIPKKIPIVKLCTKYSGPIATLNLLIRVMYIVQIFGDSRGVDPGKPKIPEFGRKLYHLHMPIKNIKTPPLNNFNSLQLLAISRKINKPISSIAEKKIIEYWFNSYNRFVKKIKNKIYYAIIFDYDGTLCDVKDRFTGASKKIGIELTRILKNDIIIGVVTGRGKSVRFDLQKIIPKRYWSNIYIGYYNGSDIGLLYDENKPNKCLDIDINLNSLLLVLKSNSYINKICDYEVRPNQITFIPNNFSSIDEVVTILPNYIAKANTAGLQILVSNHSIDVLAPGISKLNFVKNIKKILTEINKPPSLLCIGDKGKWPGNDYSLLSEEFSLSVDCVSKDPESCWNLAPKGHRGVQATLSYLKALETKYGGVILNCKKLGVNRIE